MKDKKKTNKDNNRRDFLKKASLIGAGLIFAPAMVNNALANSKNKSIADHITKAPSKTSLSPVSIVNGDDPYQMTRKAVDLLGGMKKFVDDGDIVFIKPNMSWAQSVNKGATTHPDVVKAVVEMCYEAGAVYVYVADITCNTATRAYKLNGIEEAAIEAGAECFKVGRRDIVEKDLGGTLGKMSILEAATTADKLINVPIAKHHSLAKLTLSMKNLMGLVGGSRSSIHWNISQKLADLANYFRPALNIVDAYRIMVKHGPSGGRDDDVVLMNKTIASPDIVAADTMAASLFVDVKDKDGETVSQFSGLDPRSIGYIQTADSMGLGTSDQNKMDILRADI